MTIGITSNPAGRRGKPEESPGLLPASHYDEKNFEDFLDQDLAARRELTGALAGGRPLNMRKLIARFGGPTMLHQRLISRGFRITVKAIEKWRERGRMSTSWLNELYVMAAEEGRPLLLEHYIIGFPADLISRVRPAYERDRSAAPLSQARKDHIASAKPHSDTLLD